MKQALAKIYRFLGSLPMAVILLMSLGIALALGTRHEALYGTPAAQHYFYRAIWFQFLLAFLSINLVISALHRLPWGKRHIGFAMTHLGIILLLIGNLIGIWFGVEGSLFIPEGETRGHLELPSDVLWVQPENPGIPSLFPLQFNARPWTHDVHQHFSLNLEDKSIRITVDKYFPNAFVVEKVISGEEEFPAVRLELSDPPDKQEAWLFSRDPERFGFRWGPAHVLFFELRNEEELAALEHPALEAQGKGTLRLEFPKLQLVRDIPVDSALGQTIPLEGTPYALTLHDYFPDFILTEEGPRSRSETPRNPALSFTLKGPEGRDNFLVFALHPEFEERHGIQRHIRVKALYEATTPLPSLPPALIGIVRLSSQWRLILTSPDGSERKMLPLVPQETYTHPWLDLSFKILEVIPKAELVQEFHLKDNEVKRQAIHVVVEQEGERQERWIPHGGVGHFLMTKQAVAVAYQPATRHLPFSVTLVDFRKKEYPGTTVPSAFESDVEIRDETRGLRLSKTISMNHPLTYRGYTMFQSSFAEEPVETTVLSVRKDPGTPVVYIGFITVVAGVVLMFYLRTDGTDGKRGKR